MEPDNQMRESNIQNRSYPELLFFHLIFLLWISTNDIYYGYPDYQLHNQMQYNTYLPLLVLNLILHSECPDYFPCFQLQEHFQRKVD